MRAPRMASLVVVSSLLLFIFFLPAIASAQSSITGLVRDTSGAVLPGVTVEATSPALIEGARTAVTDGQGLYRIVDLRPGPYTVTFTLPGFSTLRREGIVLQAEFTATVNAELAVGALEETITVSGEAPTVDIRSSRAQVQFASETLEAIPGTGRLATLSAVIPGATMVRETDRGVGGLSERAQTNFYIHGAPNAQPIVDGMNFEMNALNLGVFVYNQLNIQEVVVETSGVGADRDTGGMQLNMVGKDGGNTFSGTAMFAYAGPSLEMSNLNSKLLARHLDPQRVGAIKRFRDSGGALGGPFRRNKLWFFVAAREGVTQQFVEGIYFEDKAKGGVGLPPGVTFYVPDLSRPAYTNPYSKDITLRLTWQAAQKHKILVASSFQPNCNCFFGILDEGTRRTPQGARAHHYDPNYIPTFSWTYPASNRVLLEAGGALNSHNQNDTRQPGVSITDIRITDLGLNLVYGATDSRTLPRRQYHERFAVSYVTGSHSFKTGLNLRQLTIGNIKRLGHDLYMHGTAVNYTFRNRVPVSLQILDAPWNFEESGRDIAVYAQDQWTIRKLTLNLGLRYNDAKAWTPEQILGAGFFVPERRFAPVDNVPHWRNLSPRVGAAYDLFGTGRTALKVSLGQYADLVRNAVANPAVNLTRFTNRNWNDANGNYVPDCDLLNPAVNGECGAWSNLNFGKPRTDTTRADDALEGFNDQFHNWQGSVSIQHELRPGIGLNVGYFRTWYGGFLATDNQLVTPADYDPYCITAPVDSRLPNSGQQVCGFYDIKPTLFGQVDNLVTQASHYGKQSQVYNGVDVTMNARFGQGGQLSGGLSVGRTVTDNCYQNSDPSLTAQGPATTALVPRVDAFCHVVPPWSQGTQLKFLAVYPMPWDIQTSMIYQNSSGIPIAASYVATNAEVFRSLGRNLGSCRGAATCNATVTVDLIPPNTMFEPRLQQVDFRFTRIFRLGGTRRLRGNLDVYNILNASSVLSMNTRYSPPGGVWQDVGQILSGRLLKLGAQLDF